MEHSDYKDENAITPIVEKTFLESLGINPNGDDIKRSHSALAINSINETFRVIEELNSENARSRNRTRVELAENVSLAVDNIVKGKQLRDKDSIVETIVKYKSDISSISEERLGYQNQIDLLKGELTELQTENTNFRQAKMDMEVRLKSLETEIRKIKSIERIAERMLSLLGDTSNHVPIIGNLKQAAKRELISNLERIKEIIYE